MLEFGISRSIVACVVADGKIAAVHVSSTEGVAMTLFRIEIGLKDGFAAFLGQFRPGDGGGLR